MPRRTGDGRPVAGVGVGVGGDFPDAPVPAGGDDDRLGVEDVQLAGGQFHRHHAQPSCRPSISRSITWNSSKKLTLFLRHCWYSVCRIMCPVRSAAWQARRTGLPVTLLVCPPKGRCEMRPIGRAVEGQAHVFQFENGLDGLLAHELDGILVAEVIGALDRVVGVPFGVVFFEIAERRANAALRRAGVRAGGIQFADDGCLGGRGGVQTRHQTRAARADDDHFKLMNVHNGGILCKSR